MLRFFLSTVVCCCLGACSTLPRYENPITGGVTPADVVHSVECELIAALPIWRAAKKKRLVTGHMIAVAELTLQVDEQRTLTPSFTHTGVSTAAFANVFNWGAKLDSTSNRTYTEIVVFEFDPDKHYKIEERACGRRSAPQRAAITSTLGLAEVIDRGINTESANGQLVGMGAGFDPGKGKMAFGQSVNFVVTMNLNGLGPTWTLQHFKGPGQLFFTQRQDTHKVVISFADYNPNKKSEPPTERYLKILCRRLSGTDCVEEKSASELSRPRTHSMDGTVPPEKRDRGTGPAAGVVDERARNEAINAARSNNLILRQNFGTVLPPLQ